MEITNTIKLAEMISYFRKAKFADGLICPFCNSKDVVKNGTYKEKQRYKCKECKHTFSDFTNTPLHYTHYLDKWASFIECTIGGLSLRASGAALSISYVCLFYWRHKLLTALKQAITEDLEKVVEADDIYLAYSEKGKKSIIGREPKERGSGTGHIILNKDNVCVVTVLDHYENTVFAVGSRGNLEREHVDKLIGHLIDKKNTLCCNLKSAYKSFSIQKGIKCFRSSFFGIGESEKYNFRKARIFLERFYFWFLKFRGVATKYLNNYLSLYKFSNSIDFDLHVRNIRKMIEVISKQKVNETYRSLNLLEFVL